ncbi:FtsH protease activity modulator HflK [Flocculibacter collagenilyticus]|uniref:FtsH protease activity modulator HflK n=1 Tax=Flocculibacter collagenilyticus TaxID=2744479 RepID=UPI0018F2EB97|nr:FtsH protease activity modulator HflK [Flocculibacter collagenilyticus]
MAWNEPGNNGKDNDPWKQKGGRDQGPPDLDQFFKELSDKFGGLFGGGGKGGQSGSSPATSIGLTLIIVIALLVWFISGFYSIKEAEKGLVLRFGQFYEIKEPGLRWNPPFIDEVFNVDVQTIRTLPASGFMLTEDENVVRVEFEVQYRVVDPRNYKFSVTNADESLREAMDSALRYVVGHSKMDAILTSGREDVRQKTWQEIEKIIEPYNLGITISDVNFKDARPPEEVKAAFDDAISAQEDEERFIREAEAYAREIEPAARGRVNRMNQEAQAYKQRVLLEAQGEVAKFEKLLPEYEAAPQVTRQRLYLDAMEAVFSATSKVIVDVEGGGNMMYLPLDKIMQNQNRASSNPKKADVQSIRDTVTTNNTQSSSNQTKVGVRSDRTRSGRN